MDARQLMRYAMFAKFGAFGVEPGIKGAKQFLRIAEAGLDDPRAILWMTAEGKLIDPRTRPVTLKPGLSYLATRRPNALYVPAAIEYMFWNDSRPEALIRFGDAVPASESSRFSAALTDTMDQLARESALRDPALFTMLLSGSVGVGLIYDTWCRLRAWKNGLSFSPRHDSAP